MFFFLFKRNAVFFPNVSHMLWPDGNAGVSVLVPGSRCTAYTKPRPLQAERAAGRELLGLDVTLLVWWVTVTRTSHTIREPTRVKIMPIPSLEETGF